MQKLQADIASLKQQLLAQSMQPEQLVGGVVHSLRSLADIRSKGEEERYSHSDLNGFAANLDGTRKVIELMRPLLVTSNADLLKRIDSATAALDEQIKASTPMAFIARTTK